MAFSYANRAMAYLKLEEYSKVIEDADAALKLKPGYLKAYHRKGKAYGCLELYEKAVENYLVILEEEPSQADVLKDLEIAKKKWAVQKHLHKEKVEVLIKKIDSKKAQAAKLFKSGDHRYAKIQYESALEHLEKAKNEYTSYKKEISRVQASVLNNLAACSHKDENASLEIEYTTKVIELKEFLEADSYVLLKAYLRRALTYESQKRFKEAMEDLKCVQSMQPDNKQALKCLKRCEKGSPDPEAVD